MVTVLLKTLSFTLDNKCNYPKWSYWHASVQSWRFNGVYWWLVWQYNGGTALFHFCSYVRLTEASLIFTRLKLDYYLPHQFWPFSPSVLFQVFSEPPWLLQRRGRYPSRSQKASSWATRRRRNGGWGKSLAKAGLDWSTSVHILFLLDGLIPLICFSLVKAGWTLLLFALWLVVCFGKRFWGAQELKLTLLSPAFIFVSCCLKASRDVDRPVAADADFVIKLVSRIVSHTDGKHIHSSASLTDFVWDQNGRHLFLGPLKSSLTPVL